MKKFVAILFCCLACAIHFGHSIIPHSHHHVHNAKDHDHHHDNESENESIFDLFAHFGQSAETFTPQTTQKINASTSSAIISVRLDLLQEINLTVNYKFPPDNLAEPYIFISPHLTSFHFRGPPVNI